MYSTYIILISPYLPSGIDGPPFSVDLSFLIYNIADRGRSSTKDTDTITEILAVVDWFSLWSDHKQGWDTEIREWDLSATAGTLKDIQQRECIRQSRNPIDALILKKLRICPNRLWNLAVGRSSDFSHMLLILDHLNENEQHFVAPRPSHYECTEELCIRAYDDTTTIQQLHKCSGSSCGTVEFPLQKLDEVFRSLDTPTPWIPSAWNVSVWGPGATPNLADLETKFIAISHVWSDGTGNGLHPYGLVNTCLIEYWTALAKALNCDGLWWDTICIPMERQSRRKALNVMLENYSRAAYVVVHDQELVNMPWTDSTDGAIALLVSSWFTRGWTAAEFYATRKNNSIKILFKNPDGSSIPVIKDLDRDILCRPQQATTLVHMKASAILRGVREDVEDLRRLSRVLRTRSTAWEKDKMVIASLMTLDQSTVDTSKSTPTLTRDILRKLISIPKTSMFHNKVPMAARGGWSWCPSSIFDLDVNSYSNLEADTASGGQQPVMIREDGSAHGRFVAYAVPDALKNKALPYSSHPSLVYKILKALETPETCLILRVGGTTTESVVTPGILVEPVFTCGKYIDCRYVGCVHMSFPISVEGVVVDCSIGGNDLNEHGVPRPAINTQAVLEDVNSNASGKSPNVAKSAPVQ